MPPADMFDTITLDTVPSTAQAVAGYTSGIWPTFGPLCARFPKLAKAGRVLSIAIHVDHDADALDVEPGDATNDQAAAWVQRQLARGLKRPVVYSSVSNMPDILARLAAAGIHRDEIRVWTAHYNYKPHLCSTACGFGFTTTADATQFNDHALGRNLDQSRLAADFFGKPPSRPNPHYDWFYAQPELNERPVVKEYDRLRDRPLSRIIPNRPKLRKLRIQLAHLAQHVAGEARSHPNKDGTPSWQDFHRGWRYQQLLHRAAGRRVA